MHFLIDFNQAHLTGLQESSGILETGGLSGIPLSGGTVFGDFSANKVNLLKNIYLKSGIFDSESGKIGIGTNEPSGDFHLYSSNPSLFLSGSGEISITNKSRFSYAGLKESELFNKNLENTGSSWNGSSNLYINDNYYAIQSDNVKIPSGITVSGSGHIFVTGNSVTGTGLYQITLDTIDPNIYGALNYKIFLQDNEFSRVIDYSLDCSRGIYKSLDLDWINKSATGAYSGAFAVRDVCMTKDGSYQIASISIAGIWESFDYGNSWIKNEDAPDILLPDMPFSMNSSDGKYQMFSFQKSNPIHNEFYRSSDSGNNWTEILVLDGIVNSGKISISTSGQYRIVNNIVSSDYGVTWSTKAFTSGYSAIQSDEQKQYYALNTGLLISDDMFSTYTTIPIPTLNGTLKGIAVSEDGKYILINSNHTTLEAVRSRDYGANWIKITFPTAASAATPAMSHKGNIQSIGGIYNSRDYGETWDYNSDGGGNDLATDEFGRYWLGAGTQKIKVGKWGRKKRIINTNLTNLVSYPLSSENSEINDDIAVYYSETGTTGTFSTYLTYPKSMHLSIEKTKLAQTQKDTLWLDTGNYVIIETGINEITSGNFIIDIDFRPKSNVLETGYNTVSGNIFKWGGFEANYVSMPPFLSINVENDEGSSNSSLHIDISDLKDSIDIKNTIRLGILNTGNGEVYFNKIIYLNNDNQLVSGYDSQSVTYGIIAPNTGIINSNLIIGSGLEGIVKNLTIREATGTFPAKYLFKFNEGSGRTVFDSVNNKTGTVVGNETEMGIWV